MTLVDLKRTVARTTGPKTAAGTAFLVSPTHALTCAHCVVDLAGQAVATINLYFSTWTGERTRQASVESVDFERDIALLKLSAPAPMAPCPRSLNAVDGSTWLSFGHPNPTGRLGITIGGEVVDVHAHTGEAEREVIQLRCHEARDSLHGASGSPVFADGRIVGMITNQAKMWGKPGGDGVRPVEPAYGTLFAVPMRQVAASPGLRAFIDWAGADESPADALPATPPTDAQLLLHYRQIVESSPKLSSIKVPGSSGAIETVALDSIYVEPAIAGLAKLGELWSRQRVAVVGEEGSGKAAFLKHLNLRLLRDAGDATLVRLWPLHVELDRFAKQAERTDLVAFGLDDLLGRAETALRSHLEACGRDGRLVLLAVGLEQVEPAAYARVIDALSRQRRFVVAVRSGRPADVGQESGGTLRLLPFDRRRIQAFIGKWAATIGLGRGLDEKQVMNEVAGHDALLELARTPRFLALICSAWSSGSTVVPTRAALITTAWETVWRTTLGRETYARRRAAAKALGELARGVFEKGLPVRSEFDEEELFDALARAGETAADEVVARLIECEILAPTGDGGFASRSFRFPFDSFQDYLASAHLADDPAFLTALPDLKLDSRWDRVLPIISGILGRNDKRLPALRTFFAALSALKSGEALGLHTCLVAECLAEVQPDLLAALAPIPERIGAALLQTWTQQSTTRSHVLRAVRRLQPVGMRERLREIANDPGTPVDQRAPAVFALSAFRGREASDAVIALATGHDAAQVRAGALYALAARDHDDAARITLDALRDPEMLVQLAAVRCLAMRRDRSLAARMLDAWLETAAHRQRIDNELLRLIAEVGWMLAILTLRPEATLPTLLDAVTDGPPGVQQLSLSVLAEAGARAGVWPGMVLLESEHAAEVIRQEAAQMLVRLGTETALAALRQAFERDDEAAKLGAFAGFSIVEQRRNDPAAALMFEATDATLGWALIRSLELDTLKAQSANVLKALQPAIASKGRDAVLAEARAAFAVRTPATAEPSPATDLLSQFVAVFNLEDGTLDRLIAFETIQVLEGRDPDALLEGLFDTDSRVALRAAFWVRTQPSALPAQPLLERLDALPAAETQLAYWGAVNALARLEQLGTLVEHHRAGSRAAAHAMWLLCSQFGLRYHEDGRFELPDRQVETDCTLVAARLRQLDAASARPPEGLGADLASSSQAAQDDYLAARRSEPNDAAGWASLAVLQARLGEIDLAVASLGSAIELDPGSAQWHRFRGAFHFDNEAYVEAAHDFERAVELGDTRPDRHVDLGDAWLALERFEPAAAAYSRALAVEPERADAMRGRARANASLGRHGDAAEDLAAIDAAQAGSPLHPADAVFWPAYLVRARRRLAKGDLDEAHTDAKRVILADPFHPSARVLRARVWVEQGHPEFAIFDLLDLAGRLADADAQQALAAALDELVELQGVHAQLTDRQRADARGVRGTVLGAFDRIDAALEDLEASVAGGATDWRILNSLAWFYADRTGTNLEQASDLATRALEAVRGAALASDEDRGLVLDTLGWTYHKRGLHEQARTALDEAVSLCPTDEAISVRRAIAWAADPSAPRAA